MIELINGEKIDFSSAKNTSSKKTTDEDINNKYRSGDLRIVTEQARYPLDSILHMIKSGKYKLNPEFQRRHRWDNIRKSKLIESFIMNVPIPPIFLYEVDYSKFEVMDGLQRLTAISEFYENKFKLEGLEEWEELNGRKYDELPLQIKKGIDRRYLSSIILLEETAKNTSEAEFLKQMVFERINSGGEKLEPQETRNALLPGKLNSLCLKLARNKTFCGLWNIPKADDNEIKKGEISNDLKTNFRYKKMEDVELVLRFFAYRQIDSLSGFQFHKFLDKFLKEGNEYRDEILDYYSNLFIETCEFAFSLFGDKAFKLKDMPATLWYDPMMQVLSLNLKNKDTFLKQKTAISDKYKKFQLKNKEYFQGNKTNYSDVKTRINLLNSFFNELNI